MNLTGKQFVENQYHIIAVDRPNTFWGNWMWIGFRPKIEMRQESWRWTFSDLSHHGWVLEEALPLLLQPVHVSWLCLCPNSNVLQLFGQPRCFSFWLLVNCGQLLQGKCTCINIKNLEDERPLFLGDACSDVSGGAESPVRSHQGFCSNCHDSGETLIFSSGMNFLQVSGRNLFLWMLIGNEERMQTQPFVFYLFMTYSSIEVFRCKILVCLFVNFFPSKVSLLYSQHLWQEPSSSDMAAVILAWDIFLLLFWTFIWCPGIPCGSLFTQSGLFVRALLPTKASSTWRKLRGEKNTCWLMPKQIQVHYPAPKQLEHCVPPAQHNQILPPLWILPHALQSDVPYVQPEVW